ncbi:hypothetical protein P1P68_18795 [Streptomyces scabiei]|uniref:hypothetical protein n=1 Tax=Streptomyces scabiei TaxID=1930 RepID=UPI00298FC0EA|nr:hypothetical protein [Streptomyces scabiei]MDW8806777.1 hypothetical protein [Streptomyces scabiei]
MRKRLKARVATLLAASALLAGSSLTFGANNAAAATWTFEKSAVESDGTFYIYAYYNGTYAGLMEWNADPIEFQDSTRPGDAFRVLDRLSDGYGMEATMISPEYRRATTRGHSAVYYSPWQTGDLAEGTKVFIQLCAVNGDYESCSLAYSGHA